jgi:hypothetical protein
MKITILGSLVNAVEIEKIAGILEKKGHTVFSHGIMRECGAEGEKAIRKVKDDHANMKQKHDIFSWYFNTIGKSDCVVCCNFDKGEKKNYIGGNVLMELGFAYVLKKTIYLLQPIPDYVSYSDELIALKPIVINNELEKIGL